MVFDHLFIIFDNFGQSEIFFVFLLRLGQIEKDYISSGNEGMIAPLQRYSFFLRECSRQKVVLKGAQEV